MASPEPREGEVRIRVAGYSFDAGSKPVKRLKAGEVIHGSPSGMVLVMDFDSPDAITGMFESEDYAALVPVRDRGFAEGTFS